jgi:methyl-accepting chemotaxis protein
MKMSIGTRILVGYGVALLVTGAVGVVVYRGMSEVVATADWVTHSHKVKEAITEVRSALKDAETGQRGFLLTGEERYLEPYNAGVEAVDGDIQDLRELTADNSSQQKLTARLRPVVASKLAELAETIAMRKQGNERAALEIVRSDRGKKAMEEARRIMAQMTADEDELVKQRDRAAKATAGFVRATMIFGALLILVLVSTAGIVIQRSITIPLAAFIQFAGHVGEGDLTQQVKTSGGDELGKLGEHLNRMVEGLKQVAGQTRLTTGNLNSSAAEILASTQQQAAGTSEQSAAILQTTSTMEEVTRSGVQISERARQVASSAEATSAASLSGLQAVENTARNMESIRDQAEAVAENVVALSEKTQAIGDIISTVNDLAEQSHLLSLNAAIEAAAAGEHGRTFSVIAGEVKNLADQSRDATVQVRAILSDIQKGINTSVMLTEEAVKRVDSGKQQADMADRVIREMTEGIQQSVQAFQQIVAAANQQQVGFSQVMQAVREIGQASLQTAASTSQLEKEAVNLTVLGQQLRQSVERYRI